MPTGLGDTVPSAGPGARSSAPSPLSSQGLLPSASGWGDSSKHDCPRDPSVRRVLGFTITVRFFTE